MFWLLTLPFRLLAGLVFAVGGLVLGLLAVVLFPLFLLLWLPLLIVRGALRAVGALVLVALTVLGGALLTAVVLLPLLPLALLLAGVWVLVRWARPRAFAV